MEAMIMLDVLDEAIFVFFRFFLLYIHVLKQVPIYFGCSEECCYDDLEL